jgi:two-component system, cell cycle sensor histidine kinase and response regulator CckA
MKSDAIDILLVEDNPGDSRLIHEVLKEGGLTRGNFLIAENLAKAKACLPTRTFDVILLDLNLPDANGLEALERIIAAVGTMTPIIVITGLDNEAVGLAAIEAGAEDYLVKGAIDAAQLSRSIRYAIKRKELAHLLRREQDRAQGYLDMVNTIIVALDNEGRITTINRKGCRILGYEEEELIGRLWFSTCLLQPQGMEELYPSFLKIMAGAPAMEYSETPIVTRGGEVQHVAWHVSLLRDEQGTITGTLSAGDDITERKQAEVEKGKLEAQLQQAQKMESVGRLAGGVAHDFNNMLNVILGYAQIALDKTDPASPLYDDLQEILSAGVRSANITRQLLAFARKQTIAPEILDLNETIENMLKMLRRLIGEDINLIWMPAKEIWPIKMDISQIDQILANICVNARDAIKGVGKITIETEVVTLDQEYCLHNTGAVAGEYVCLAVSDDGSGIAPEILRQIFEPFFTTKEMGQGTGLGLSTVYGIVKQNNGFISVYSEPGEGTTFRIYLPKHCEPGGITAKQKELPIQRGKGETVLVVEDELAILKLTAKILKDLGYAVLTAAGPAEAIELARGRREAIHLLITDVVMPKMNGRDLAGALLAMYPELRCLFMSGYSASVIARQGILEANIDFIQKPFSARDLAAKIRKVLGFNNTTGDSV